MWWYPLVDTAIILGGSFAIFFTILGRIPWLLIAVALGAAFWFYGPVEAMIGPIQKSIADITRSDPPPFHYTQSPAPAAPVYTAPPVYVPPPVYAYTAPTVYAGRTVPLFPHAFGGGGHAFGGRRR